MKNRKQIIDAINEVASDIEGIHKKIKDSEISIADIQHHINHMSKLYERISTLKWVLCE